MTTKKSSKENTKKTINRTMDIKSVSSSCKDCDYLCYGKVSDVYMHKDNVFFEIYLDKSGNYKYFNLNLDKGEEIKNFESSIGSYLDDIIGIIGTEILIYQKEQNNEHYVIYSSKNLIYVENSKFFNLDKPEYKNNIEIKDTGHIIYIVMFLVSMIPLFLLTNIHILFVLTLSGMFSLIMPSIIADILGLYYNITSKKLN